MKTKKHTVNDELCDKAYDEALRVLRNCSHPLGMKASASVHGYPQIWSRDSMIALLGATCIKDAKVRRSLKSSFNILAKRQTSLGAIPNNVDVRTLKPNFQAYADCGLWFVIGNAIFFKQTSDKIFLKKNYPAIKKVLRWYEYQDVDQTGLISMAEASDWEDLFAVRGKGLYVNILYYLALKNAGFIAKQLGDKTQSGICKKKARQVHSLINKYFWYNGDTHTRCYVNFITTHAKIYFGTESYKKKELSKLINKCILPCKTILRTETYYLPYITFRDFGEWFDSFGNLLAILSGIADDRRPRLLLNFIKRNNLVNPFPIKAIHPHIPHGGKDWREYYHHGNRNSPHQYHNGGIWPFLGGFYVAVLVKMKKYSEAQKALRSLARLNKQGKKYPWEFNYPNS
jgi:glycogen debranching enzyme